MMDDSTLVARCQAGDEEAFNELIKRYSGRAYQSAYGILGNREDAEEVAQDTFVRIHRGIGGFRGEAEFSTWMYRIAMNLARNKYRWNKVRGSKVNFSMDAPLEDGDNEERKFDVADDALSPERKFELDDTRQRLETLLGTLSPAYREILVLRNVQDMSYEDIADKLGVELGTVKSRLARAREALKQALQADK